MHTGLDLGLTATAIVTIDDSARVLSRVVFGRNNNGDLKEATRYHPAKRYKMYSDRLQAYFETYSVTGTVVMEDTNQMVGNARKLTELKGVYLVSLYNTGINIDKLYVPSATFIKKMFTGDGSASKEDVMEACKRLGFLPRNEHEADAYAMAWIGLNGFLQQN